MDSCKGKEKRGGESPTVRGFQTRVEQISASKVALRMHDLDALFCVLGR